MLVGCDKHPFFMALLTIQLEYKASATGLYRHGNWYFDIAEVNDYWLWRLFKREFDGRTYKYECIVISSEATLDPEYQIKDVKLFIEQNCLQKIML